MRLLICSISLTQATWQQTDINNHMVVCTDLAMHSLPYPHSFLYFPSLWWVILNPNRLLNHRPHHTMSRLQPPGARRGLGARRSISDGARGGWSAQGFGGDLRVGVFTRQRPCRMCPPPHPTPQLCLSHHQTSFCSSASPVNVHTVVCTHMCVLSQYCWCYCVKSSFWSGPGQLSFYLHHQIEG